MKRTIIIGFDGMDARLTRALLRSGCLPHLAALIGEGRFHEVLSTTPAESAVAWTAFNYASNPGATGIFDFIHRAPGSYAPSLSGSQSQRMQIPRTGCQLAAAGVGALAGGGALALTRGMSRRSWLRWSAAAAAGALGAACVAVPGERWLPHERVSVSSTISGTPWWESLAAAGMRSVVLKMPLTYPVRTTAGVELLAGLGVPDMAGTSGTYLLLSDTPAAWSVKGHAIGFRWIGDRAEVQIPGPDGFDRTPCKARVRLERSAGDALQLQSGDRTYRLEPGIWSNWIHLTFRLSPLLTLKGLTRMLYLPGDDRRGIYVCPVEFDPAERSDECPLSGPHDFAARLQAEIGEYHTLGWDTQTSGLVDGVLDRRAYLADLNFALDCSLKLLESCLSRCDWENLMLVVQATDQAQHVLFDDVAEASCGGAAIERTGELPRLYRRMDEVVGRLRAAAGELGARLVVMSDHGFCRYRRSVNLNTWLAQRGWLALKDRRRRDDAASHVLLSREPWENVDWFNTRAYALGLAGIYFNVAGREPAGIVRPGEELEHLRQRLIEDLMEWRDPASGDRILAEARSGLELYQGVRAEEAPDVVLGFKKGWRVSGASAVGGIPAHEVVSNDSAWLADHCGVAAEEIPGVCVTSFVTDWPSRVAIGELPQRLWPQLS